MPKAGGPHNIITKQIVKGVERVSRQEARDIAQKSYWRMSWVDDCDAKLGFLRLGTTPESFAPDVKLKMDKGNVLHDHIRTDLFPLTRDFTVHQEEIELELIIEIDGIKFRMVGHTDGMLGRKRYAFPWSLLEVKTTSMYGYKTTRDKNFQDPEHYSLGYFTQSNRYGHAWNQGVDRGDFVTGKVKRTTIFLYDVNGGKDKDTGAPMRDWTFLLDKQAFHRDMQRIARIERSLRDGLPLTQGYEAKSWKCQGCQFFERCWQRKRSSTPARSPEEPRNVPAAGKPTASGIISG